MISVEDTGGTPFLGQTLCGFLFPKPPQNISMQDSTPAQELSHASGGGGGGADWGPADKIMDKLILMA